MTDTTEIDPEVILDENQELLNENLALRAENVDLKRVADAKPEELNQELLAAVEALRKDRDSWKTVADSYEADRLEQKTEIKALRERVETARLEVEQCHAKSTCCCGDYIKQHSAYDGHTPVPMYDYALDGAEARAEAAQAQAVELADILRSLLALPVAETALSLLDRGIGTNTPNNTWLNARIALAAMPADALERAKAKDAVIDQASEVYTRLLVLLHVGKFDPPDQAVAVEFEELGNRLARLDTLDQPAKEAGT